MAVALPQFLHYGLAPPIVSPCMAQTAVARTLHA